jgi:hypothetical protein
MAARIKLQTAPMVVETARIPQELINPTKMQLQIQVVAAEDKKDIPVTQAVVAQVS